MGLHDDRYGAQTPLNAHYRRDNVDIKKLLAGQPGRFQKISEQIKKATNIWSKSNKRKAFIAFNEACDSFESENIDLSLSEFRGLCSSFNHALQDCLTLEEFNKLSHPKEIESFEALQKRMGLTATSLITNYWDAAILSDTYHAQGRHQEALTTLKQALKMAQDDKDNVTPADITALYEDISYLIREMPLP